MPATIHEDLHMDDAFREKIRTAAIAAWWTVGIGVAFFTVQWVAYRLVLSAKPTWVLAAWGPGATWDGVRAGWFGALVFMKLSLWLVALVALWLTLWARQGRSRGEVHDGPGPRVPR